MDSFELRTKAVVGDKVTIVTRDNYAAGQSATVTKVGRKYGEITLDGGSYTMKFDLATGWIDLRGDVSFVLTDEQIDEHRRRAGALAALRDIAGLVVGLGMAQRLREQPTETLEAMAALL